METKHTPTPWKWTPCETEKEPDGELTIYQCADIKDAKGRPIFTIDMDGYMGLSDQTASYIVQCVNAHDELIEQMENVIDVLNFDGTFTVKEILKTVEGARANLRKAIAKAEGK